MDRWKQLLANLEGQAVSATERFSGGDTAELLTRGGQKESTYRGAQGLDADLVERIEKMYGFDKPLAQTLRRNARQLRHLRFR